MTWQCAFYHVEFDEFGGRTDIKVDLIPSNNFTINTDF